MSRCTDGERYHRRRQAAHHRSGFFPIQSLHGLVPFVLGGCRQYGGLGVGLGSGVGLGGAGGGPLLQP
jgi:hypothetical protein